MDASFKNAVVISLMIHSAVLMPAYHASLQTPDIKPQRQILVDYVRLEEPKKAEARKKDFVAKTEETPKVEPRKNVVIKPVENLTVQVQQKTTTQKTASADLANLSAELKVRPEQSRGTKKQARVKSTKDYVNYFQLIRDKIRQRLKINYRDFRREGDVNIDFTLRADGSLLSVTIENGSTADDTLRDITTKSVKEASPFMAFPKALNLPNMSFNLVVSFKKE